MKKSETVIRLEKERQLLQSDGDRLREALGAVMDGSAVLVGQFTLDGQTVKARLVGWDRAHGGIVLLSEHMQGGSGRPMHRVHYLEQYQSDLRNSGHTEYSRQLRDLVEKVARKAYQLRQTGEHNAHIQRGRYEAGCQECLKAAREVSAREAQEDSTAQTLKAIEAMKDL